MGRVTPDYAQKWTEYRNLRNQFLFVLTGYFPLVVTLFIILPVSRFDLVFRLLNLCWLVLLVFAAFRLRNWRCPNCGGRFFAHSERRGLSLLTKNCGNCQLPKYSG